MSDIILNKEDCFNALPPEWEGEFLQSIRNQIKEDPTKIVILDDDPTGTQTVHGLSVLTTWPVDALKQELMSDEPAFFVLTNSRSLPVSEARSLAHDIGMNLRQASELVNTGIRVISRSDSTLRGHFPDELEPLAKELGQEDLPYLLVPFFLEGGRFTIQNIHYVAEGTRLVPAAMTSYANDPAFGFSNSNLCKWVEEKTRGRIPSNRVKSVSLDDIRSGGPEKVTARLQAVADGTACIVNAVSYRDIEVLAAGLIQAWKLGRHFLYRSAASFVRVITGNTPTGRLLSKEELVGKKRDHSNGGLFVVGSYVPKTTRQLRTLLDQTSINGIMVDVNALLDDGLKKKTVKDTAEKASRLIKHGEDVVVYTSRNLIDGQDSDTSLKIGQKISNGILMIVQRIEEKPRYLLAKGGITSSDIATKALNVQKAVVLGQILPGVPVWKLGEESRFPDLAYIIFPGNVGSDDALVSIHREMNP